MEFKSSQHSTAQGHRYEQKNDAEAMAPAPSKSGGLWVGRSLEGRESQSRGGSAFPDIVRVTQGLAAEPLDNRGINMYISGTYFVCFLRHVMFHDKKRL